MVHHFETLQLHAGQAHGGDTGTKACAVPIFATTSFSFKDSAHGAQLFNLTAGENDHCYSRLSNPTVAVFEQRIAALEGGVAAVASASGQAAHLMAIAALAHHGDNIVAFNIDTGHFSWLKRLSRFGVELKLVRDEMSVSAAIDDNTKAVLIESIGPEYRIPDFATISNIAHKYGVPLVVDNTAGASGHFIRPIDHGADIIVHSASGWIGGHENAIGGVVVDSGKFNWNAHAARFPDMVEPSPGYHGLSFWKRFGRLTFAVRVRLEVLRDAGPCLNPFAAFQLLQGVETLSLRAQRQSRNALALARWLKTLGDVSWVSYLGLETHTSHELAKQYLSNGHGAKLSFGVKGDQGAGQRVVDGLKMIGSLGNLGDLKTSAACSSSATNGPASDQGGGDEALHICVGAEHIEDIKADVLQSLQNVRF